jgi:hypothetical protein
MWFFMYAFETLTTLFYLDTVELIRNTNGNTEEISKRDAFWPVKTTSYLVSVGFISLAGLFLGFVTGLILSSKNNWFWFNTFLSLALILILMQLRLTGWSQLKIFLYFPGQLFSNLFIEFLINGVLLLSIGLLLFFLNPITRFISNKPKVN